MQNAVVAPYALFWNWNEALQCAYFINNGLQSASMNWPFLNIIYKLVLNSTTLTYRLFYGVNKRRTLKHMSLNHEDWASTQLLIFSVLTFLFTLSRCQVIFKKCLKCMMEFSRRFDLANWKYSSNFLAIFHTRKAPVKIHSRKVDNEK